MLDPIKAANWRRDEGVRIHAHAFGGEGEDLRVFGIPAAHCLAATTTPTSHVATHAFSYRGKKKAFRARDTEELRHL
jgi:hypothetical protein